MTNFQFRGLRKRKEKMFFQLYVNDVYAGHVSMKEECFLNFKEGLDMEVKIEDKEKEREKE